MTETLWPRAANQAAISPEYLPMPVSSGAKFSPTMRRCIWRFLRACVNQEQPASIGVLSGYDHSHGHQENLEVEPDRPVIDIPEVVGHARLCLLGRIDLAAQPMHLGPSGHARSHPMAMKIVADRLVIEPLAGFHRHYV